MHSPFVGRPIGFVTYSGKPGLTEDDQLAVAALARRGVPAEPLIWNDVSVGWDQYAALVLRSTWDYHRSAEAFVEWLVRVEASGNQLWNPAGLVRWNMDKRYLRELEGQGIAITPTVWLENGETASLRSLLEANGWDRAVVKPSLSATAFLTWRTTVAQAADRQAELDQMLQRGAVLVQKYEESIERGEWSLIFFNGGFSHAVLKIPERGDFRVQKEYGGTSLPDTAPLGAIAMAERTLSHVRFPWLYARVDLIESDRRWLLMELEMLEPDLFLRHDPSAPGRFAKAIVGKVGQGEAG